jgi:hypothetical protein
MIAKQDSAPPLSPVGIDLRQDPVTLGAQILKVAIAYDQLLNGGRSHEESLSWLLDRHEQFTALVVNALSNLEGETHGMEAMKCLVSELKCDMVLQEDIRTADGTLLVAKGTRISHALLARLRNFLRENTILGSVLVHVPRTSGERPSGSGSARKATAGA